MVANLAFYKKIDNQVWHLGVGTSNIQYMYQSLKIRIPGGLPGEGGGNDEAFN